MQILTSFADSSDSFFANSGSNSFLGKSSSHFCFGQFIQLFFGFLSWGKIRADAHVDSLTQAETGLFSFENSYFSH